MRADSRLMGRVRAGRSWQRPAWRLLLVSALSAALASGVAIVLADPASPVTISDVDSPDPVASGGQLTHTITVVNTGGAKISNVVLSDQLNGVGGIGVPPQLQLASTRGSCQQTGNLVTCNAGTIEGNGSWVVSIRGIVTAPNGSVLNNTVAVSGTKSAQNFTTTNTVTTNVSSGGGALPDLSINKTGPTSVPINSPMTYTLTVNNGGTQNATDIKVVDTVPADLTITSVTGTSLFTCLPPYTGNTVTCTGGAVNAGSNATITINATTPPAVPATPTITNTAVVDPENSIPESNELNNTSALVNTLITPAVTTPPLSVDITDKDAEATGAGPDPVMPGQLETFKILATNNAPTRADDVVIVLGTQYLEAASILASQVVTNGAIGTFGGCVVNAPQAKCSVRSLNPGGTILMTVQGYVIGSAGAFMSSTATVTGNIKNQGVTSQDTELTTVMPQYDLTITKSDSPDPVCASSYPGPGFPAGPPGNEYPAGNVCQGGLTYTFVVGNSGIQNAMNVVVRDPLPAGMIFDHLGLNEAGFACLYDPVANVVTCSGGAIPAQSTKKLQFVTVAPPGVGQISNTVTVDPFNAIFEGDDTNNTFTQTTQVATGVDLTVVKHSNHEAPGSVATRGTLTYTIKVTNLGTQDATNILVRDILPADTLFRDAVADPAHGFTCSQAGGIVDCTNGHIQGTKSMNYPSLVTQNVDVATITIRIFATPYEQPAMHNEVRVDPLGQIPEANENNNFAVQNTEVKKGGATSDAFNDLIISKEQVSPTQGNTARNAIVTYKIKVGNDGTDPVVGVRIRDTLPAGFRYIEAAGSNSFLCTQQVIGFVDCLGGQIAANASLASALAAQITIKAFAADTPGVYTNQVEADPEHTIAEGNEFNNNFSIQTTVVNAGDGDFNDLSVSKTANPSPVKPNQELTYTLTVSNTQGEAPALNVKVRDVLSSLVTFVSAADLGGPGAFNCSESSNIVTCIGGTIPAGGSRTITIKVKAPNLTNVTLINQAMVDPENEIPEGDEENNNFDLTTQVSSNINLSIKKDGPHTSSQNQVTDYTLTIENQSPQSQGLGSDTGQTAFNVEVHDPLPVGLIPLAIDTGANNNFTCQVLENPINVVDCIGDLNPDVTPPIQIKITVFMTAETNRSLDNEACIDPNDVIKEFSKPDGTLGETDNCSTHTSVSGTPPKKSPNFLINKSVNQSVASPGETLEYTITLSNIGDALAKGLITVTDNLPDDTFPVNITGPNTWKCDTVPADQMKCDNSTASSNELAVGASVQFTVHATVKPGASGQLVNGASVSDALSDPGDTDAENETDANKANNTATITTSVGSPGVDLAIGTITDAPDPVNPGKQVTYTIVAVNAGTQAQSNVHVKVTMPSGVSYVSADGSNGFNCDLPVGTLIDCHAASMPAGGNTTITAKFLVLLSPPGTLTLKAHIDPRPGETNIQNNDQEEVTTVSGLFCTACVDLVSALLTASPEPVASGGTVTVKYVLVNTGDLPTTLSTDPNDHQQIANFDFIANPTPGGGITGVSFAYSIPGITCSTAASPPAPASDGNHKFNDCFGVLGPGQSVVITATVSGVTGSDLFVQGVADPNHHQAEFNEGNNALNQTVVIN